MSETTITNEAMLAILEELTALRNEIASMKAQPPAGGEPKNHRASKADGSRMYTLLLSKLPMWGNVPQQQVDLASIILRHVKVGEQISETDLFAALEADRELYPSLVQSKQHVTYLFRYYRSLGNNGKYAGFIARGFLRG